MSAISDVIDDWAARELAAWQGTALDRGDVEERLRAVAAASPALCLFRIENGMVDLDPGTAAAHTNSQLSGMIGNRANLYLNLLRDAVRLFDVQGSVLIGIYVGDLYSKDVDTPLFLFQKLRGTRGILLPDVDFMVCNNFADDGAQYYDRQCFHEKASKAVFIGSTTGTPRLTADDVVHNRNQRISSALFFRDSASVIFKLPNIVQVDKADTRELIESLGITGQRVSWPAQFSNRYILSIDGNGATCSRVVLALSSNSVLVKYQSDSVLYYFHGLLPWQHYIPVRSDQAVSDTISEAEVSYNLHSNIADRSRRFAQTYLSRLNVLRYTATLLSGYIDLFGDGGRGTPPAPLDPLIIDNATHVGEVGTIWTDPGQWSGASGRHPIEGFNLFPGSALHDHDLSYRGVLADGSLTPMCKAREFCGSRGKGVALHGMTVSLSGPGRSSFRIGGRVRFADGHVQRIAPGVPLKPHAAPMTGFRLVIRERG